ncbi:ABC transporter permease [Brachybacterium sp. MASK1Z-5]|uniref:ABC transporter permease n=1 Tax=Brachybacterium halotolerans TaxID=2795215 RepID=A0ABS1BDR0_9MICO|nr:ABC transporter permease [Brachybacterium halotolerans]MBK0332780.1 ABC transporter permease [Brachybacterium halotolerans]
MSMPSLAGSARRVPLPMILMAMLFPVFMAFAYPGSYLSAMLEPAPDHMQLAVVESTKDAPQIAQQLQAEGGDAVDVTTVADTAAAKNAVTDLEARAAYDPSNGSLYVASAGGAQATSAAQSIFDEVAQKTDQTLHVKDLRGTTAADSTGTGFMYMLTACLVAGYVTATMLTSLARGVRLPVKLAVQLLMSVVAGVLTAGVCFGFYGVYDHHLVGAALIGGSLFLTASVVQLGFAGLLGQASTLVGITLFVILGVPASGVAATPDMLPGFFRVLHRLLPSGAGGELLRRVLYFDAHGIGTWVLLLVTWLLVGAGLVWLSTLRSPSADPATSVVTEEREHLRAHPEGGMFTAYDEAGERAESSPTSTPSDDPERAPQAPRHRAPEEGLA